jgi:hypothetical protein
MSGDDNLVPRTHDTGRRLMEGLRREITARPAGVVRHAQDVGRDAWRQKSEGGLFHRVTDFPTTAGTPPALAGAPGNGVLTTVHAFPASPPNSDASLPTKSALQTRQRRAGGRGSPAGAGGGHEVILGAGRHPGARGGRDLRQTRMQRVGNGPITPSNRAIRHWRAAGVRFNILRLSRYIRSKPSTAASPNSRGGRLFHCLIQGGDAGQRWISYRGTAVPDCNPGCRVLAARS